MLKQRPAFHANRINQSCHTLFMLAQLVHTTQPLLASVDWSHSRGEGKWTNLELLGHLIDSAANNHQRFVRALAQPELHWPGYDQTAHVQVQNYAHADPTLLIQLWSTYNLFLAHLIDQIPPHKKQTPCTIDGAPAMSLEHLVLDYIAHLEHHLKQLLPTQTINYSGMPWPPADPNRQWPV
ncbi:MAG: DinB family protein [Acidobacteria bacterium]|nr:DinB family protein [Acidobacteriota bacterium]